MQQVDTLTGEKQVRDVENGVRSDTSSVPCSVSELPLLTGECNREGYCDFMAIGTLHDPGFRVAISRWLRILTLSYGLHGCILRKSGRDHSVTGRTLYLCHLLTPVLL